MDQIGEVYVGFGENFFYGFKILLSLFFSIWWNDIVWVNVQLVGDYNKMMVWWDFNGMIVVGERLVN